MSAAAPQAPFFEDLRIGQRAADAPSLTVTDAHAAIHQAILGDRLRLALDADLCREVTRTPGAPILNPGLVCDVAIGQSTGLTQRVIGNLFYRGLAMRRIPRVGDTLTTVTEVVALRRNQERPGRPPTGMAVLHVVTVDQDRRPVLDFHRCAMLPVGDATSMLRAEDDVASLGGPLPPPEGLAAPVADWDLAAYRENVPGPYYADLDAGDERVPVGGDVVSSAPELARLTLNVAMAHHDVGAGRDGRRLVYGGHTIGIAAAQLSRALPSLVTVLAWRSCDHLGPVFEGDTLHSRVTVERIDPLRDGGLAHLRSVVRAVRDEGDREVLDWRLIGLLA